MTENSTDFVPSGNQESVIGRGQSLARFPCRRTAGVGETKSIQTLPKTLPGTVCEQYVRCGKPNCHCAKPKSLHGPYFYRFYRTEGRLRKQ